MDLARCFDEVLQVGSGEEVSEVDKFAMILVFDVDDTPTVLTATDLLAINNNRFLTSNNGKGDDVLDGRVGSTFLVIELIVVVWIHPNAVEGELLLYSFFEFTTFLQGQGVGLCDNWHHVDYIGQLLQDNNIDGLERVAGGLNEEETAVDASVLDVSLSLRGELFS